MKRILIAVIILAGSVANSAYKEVSLRDADAETINGVFEKIGVNHSFLASPDGSSTVNRVTYGDEGGKVVCDARGVMNNNIHCKISVDTGYKPQPNDPPLSVKVDDTVPGEISIVIFKPEDVKKIAERLPSGEFASSARSVRGGPLVRLQCGDKQCRLTFAN